MNREWVYAGKTYPVKHVIPAHIPINNNRLFNEIDIIFVIHIKKNEIKIFVVDIIIFCLNIVFISSFILFNDSEIKVWILIVKIIPNVKNI